MSDDVRESVIQRVLSTLLQQKMVTELDDVNMSLSQSYDQLLRRTANDGLMKPELARRVLAFFTQYLRQQRDNVCDCSRPKRSQPSQSKSDNVRRSRTDQARITDQQ